MNTWILVALALAQPGPTVTESPAVVTAARNLLVTLTSDQRQRTVLPLSSDAREVWHFTPQADRRGLDIGSMNATQRYLTHALLAQSLSSVGYVKTTTIMSLESLLREREQAAGRPGAQARRDPGKYHLSIFGEPSGHEPWAWSFEGHHVSWNFTMIDGEVVAASPAFLGANPHRVEDGPRAGLRILGEEEDQALALLASLDAQQLEKAVIAAELTREMVGGNVPRLAPGPAEGLAATSMRPAQRALLHGLLHIYANTVTGDAAREREAQIAGAGQNLYFAWIGAPSGKGRQYYRIQGPTFLVEYINVQNDANHVHTVWRDFEGDFGRDVLTEHLKNHAH